jgi:hypothetical protein
MVINNLAQAKKMRFSLRSKISIFTFVSSNNLKIKKMRTFEKYKENLSVVTENGIDYIKSYNTLVARIDYEKSVALVLGYYSKTTSKHINYVCNVFNIKQVKN